MSARRREMGRTGKGVIGRRETESGYLETVRTTPTMSDDAPNDAPNEASRDVLAKGGKGRPRGRQPSARSLQLPQATRAEMRRVAAFFRRAIESSALTQREIVERMALSYARAFEAEGTDPAVALERGRAVAANLSSVSRMNNPTDLEKQSDFGYRQARDILEACGYTMAMLDEALRLTPVTPAEAERVSQEREAEGVALTRFRSLSAYGQRMALAYLQQLVSYEIDIERDRATVWARIEQATHVAPTETQTRQKAQDDSDEPSR